MNAHLQKKKVIFPRKNRQLREMLFIYLFIYFYLSPSFFLSVSHTTAGPPKKRHKGWSPESCASTQPENTLKTPPSSSPLSASSVPYVVTNGARSGEGTRQPRGSSSGKTPGRLLRENETPSVNRVELFTFSFQKRQPS